jgi:hypothetical protein
MNLISRRSGNQGFYSNWQTTKRGTTNTCE